MKSPPVTKPSPHDSTTTDPTPNNLTVTDFDSTTTELSPSPSPQENLANVMSNSPTIRKTLTDTAKLSPAEQDDIWFDEDDTAEDRLSDLPDGLKLRILFFLADESDTRDVIRTSALSRGWGNLWSYVTYLHFGGLSRSRMPDAVDHTLRQYLDLGRKLERFKIRYDHKPNVDSWISFAADARVENLFLASFKYVPPLNFYTNPFFCELSLNSCRLILELGISVNWNSLVQLHLSHINLGDGVIREVLKGTPKLRTLKLVSCLGKCNIISEGLKTLIVVEVMIVLPELEIVAPKLESLHIEGSIKFGGKIQIKDVSGLVKARVIVSDIMTMTYDNLMEVMDDQVQLLTSVKHAKDITVGGWCVKALTILAMKGLASPSLDCKRLMVLTDMILEDLPAIEILLQDSFVQELVIQFIQPLYSSSIKIFHQYMKSCNDCEASTSKSEICSNVLQKVVLTGPRSVDQEEDFVKVASKWEGFDRAAFHKN